MTGRCHDRHLSATTLGQLGVSQTSRLSSHAFFVRARSWRHITRGSAWSSCPRQIFPIRKPTRAKGRALNPKSTLGSSDKKQRARSSSGLLSRQQRRESRHSGTASLGQAEAANVTRSPRRL